jgi:hypothetical protein
MRRPHLLLMFLTVFAAVNAIGQNSDDDWNRSQIRHVLLISVDGMHAVDFLNCSHGIAGVNGGAPYCPNLASLGTTRSQLRWGQHLEALRLFPWPHESRHRRHSSYHGHLLRCLV